MNNKLFSTSSEIPNSSQNDASLFKSKILKGVFLGIIFFFDFILFITLLFFLNQNFNFYKFGEDDDSQNQPVNESATTKKDTIYSSGAKDVKECASIRKSKYGKYVYEQCYTHTDDGKIRDMSECDVLDDKERKICRLAIDSLDKYHFSYLRALEDNDISRCFSNGSFYWQKKCYIEFDKREGGGVCLKLGGIEQEACERVLRSENK